MKKVIVFLLCSIILMLASCQSKQTDISSKDTISKSISNSNSTPSESKKTSSNFSRSEGGGIIIDPTYCKEYWDIDGRLIDLVGIKEVGSWIDNEDNLNIHDFIIYFNVKKEDMIRLTELYPTHTTEQIDALYSHDQKLINKFFYNQDTACYSEEDGNIYNIYWLDTHTIEEIREKKITKSDIERVLNRISQPIVIEDWEGLLSRVTEKIKQY